jgi:hypothetical protein
MSAGDRSRQSTSRSCTNRSSLRKLPSGRVAQAATEHPPCDTAAAASDRRGRRRATARRPRARASSAPTGRRHRRTRHSPRASSELRLRAAFGPAGVAFLICRTLGSPNAAMTSRVSSVDASSTTTISSLTSACCRLLRKVIGIPPAAVPGRDDGRDLHHPWREQCQPGMTWPRRLMVWSLRPPRLYPARVSHVFGHACS